MGGEVAGEKRGGEEGGEELGEAGVADEGERLAEGICEEESWEGM